MHPVLLDWGPFFVPAWHFFVAIGAIAAFYAVLTIRKRYYPNVDESHLRILFALGYLSGLLGSRMTEVLVAQEAHSFTEFLAQTFSLGGMVFYGGMLLGIGLGWAYCWHKKLSARIIIDIAAPAIFLGLAFGRIGCFLNGDDFGIPGPADSMFTVVFPNLGDNTPRYATQLMESGFAFGLFFFGLHRLKQAHPPGSTGLLLLSLYAGFRFVIEFVRDDPRGHLLIPTFTTSQTISVFVVGICLIFLLIPRFRQGKPYG